ncbi:MFS transporter [Nordella sp. HKS 07]|uniref:MFS transporter n=1 Tax=Nordella sp. HKS 07 TaxID=2712222 RepID=UPI0013E1B912|nr:MFS transporter [Nordella sp. HKS 07]QIG46659.1 MFS transporter [Nordella sp. HKS 07]
MIAIPIIGLGVTQVVGYGTLYYAFAVLEPYISREFGWPSSWSFGCLSLALLIGGLAGPFAGRLIDERGARLIMSWGSVASSIALVALAVSQNLITFALALIIVEVTSVLVLYDAAFAAIAQITGRQAARRAITQMTLLGGFASTVFWPITHFLVETMDWRSVYLIFAAINLSVCLPIHLWVLSQTAEPIANGLIAREDGDEQSTLPPQDRMRAMLWLIAYFCLTGFVYSSFNIQWVSALQNAGFTSAVAVGVGVLMGPSQVAIRFLDMLFGKTLHPLATGAISSLFLVVALAALMLAGAGVAAAVVFAVLFGLSQGLSSIVRGTIPLALFGRSGYGARLGRISAISVAVKSCAPFVFALILGSAGPTTAFAATAVLAGLSLVVLRLIPRPA